MRDPKSKMPDVPKPQLFENPQLENAQLLDDPIKYRARQIKEMVRDLNVIIRSAAEEGITTEFILDNIENYNAFHQRVKVIVSERL